jgi:phytol kinase
MIAVLCALAGMAAILFTAEILWHRKYIAGEYARKFVHILGGSFVALWPYFLSFSTVRWIALGGIIAWVATKKLNLSFALKDINRPTAGELLYPISVLLLAYIASDKWIFTVSVLFLALADGMAAVIGKKYSTKKLSYKVYRGTKSVQGSAAYLVCAYIALGIGIALGGDRAILHTPVLTLGWLPLATMFLENISPFGTDNLTVPIMVAVLLNFAVTLSLL